MDNNEIEDVVIGEYIGNIEWYKGVYRGMWTITNNNIKYKEKNGFVFNIRQKDLLEIQHGIQKNSLIIKYKTNNRGRYDRKIRVFISNKQYNQFIDALKHTNDEFELKEANKKEIYFIIFIICFFMLFSCIIAYIYF